MINTNAWNRFRYTIYQPIYDLAGRYFTRHRRTSIEALKLSPDDNILIVGAGTGLDLEFLKGFNHVTAIDITPAMISQLKRRAERLQIPVEAMIMDGSKLNFKDNYFDAVLLHLIVAVIPDPVGCLKETERVLKPGGMISIMDKFVHPGSKPSLLRRLLNPFTNLLATNIDRDIDELLSHTSFQKEKQEMLDSIFWNITAVKTD